MSRCSGRHPHHVLGLCLLRYLQHTPSSRSQPSIWPLSTPFPTSRSFFPWCNSLASLLTPSLLSLLPLRVSLKPPLPLPKRHLCSMPYRLISSDPPLPPPPSLPPLSPPFSLPALFRPFLPFTTGQTREDWWWPSRLAADLPSPPTQQPELEINKFSPSRVTTPSPSFSRPPPCCMCRRECLE